MPSSPTSPAPAPPGAVPASPTAGPPGPVPGLAGRGAARRVVRRRLLVGGAVVVLLAGGAAAAVPWLRPAEPATPATAPGCAADPPGSLDLRHLTCRLADAQRTGDPAATGRAADALATALGDRAGVPDPPDRYAAVPPGAPALTRADLPVAGAALLAAVRRDAWWAGRPGPAGARALRQPAEAVTGLLLARRAGAGDGAAQLAAARSAGDYLVWAQAQGRGGAFPFPVPAGGAGDAPREVEAAREFLAQVGRDGRRAEAVSGGWIVDDLGTGALAFDTGLAGIALLDLYAATRDGRYLAAARAAADWAVRRPAVPNWNFNGFRAALLARAAAVTGDARYADGARTAFALGVRPGQLRTGPRAGRWADPHNARGAYHWILVRQLVTLRAAQPGTRAAVDPVLGAALAQGCAEVTGRGVSTPAGALEALSLARLRLPAAARADAACAPALGVLSAAAREEGRRGRTADPAALGTHLAAVAGVTG